MSIPVVKVPTFTTTLPYSGDVIVFRPFLVKEEKILLMATESEKVDDVINSMDDIIQACTFGKVKLDDYCIADIQWLFLQIRGKSIGEEIDMMLVCGKCSEKQPYTINVSEFETVISKQNNTISVNNSVKVLLKYPTLSHYSLLYETNSEEIVYKVIVDCIEKIYDEDEMFVNEGNSNDELYEFINNLTPEQFEPFEKFFHNMPVLVKQTEFVCKKCDTLNTLNLDSINHFFA